MLRRGRPAGFSLVELVVVVTVIAVLAAVLLDYLVEYTERAEKAAMEQVAAAVRAGLHLRVAGLIVRNADAEIPALAGENPMEWLAERPHTYVGVFAGVAPRELAPPGSWYFDLSVNQLVYRAVRTRHLESPRNRENELRFRVVVEEGVLPGGERLAEPLWGLRRVELSPVEPIRWFPGE